MDNTDYKIVSCKRLKLIGLHLFGVFVFLGYEIVLLFILHTPPTGKGYLTYLLEIATFYTNFLWVMPLIGHKDMRLALAMRILTIMIIHLLLRYLIMHFHSSVQGAALPELSKERIALVFWRVCYILAIGFFLGLIRLNEERRRKQYELELTVAREREDKARLEALMAQMQLSPHMVLNVLAYIEAEVADPVPHVATAIQNFSKLVRYSLIDIRTTKVVPIQKELEAIKERIDYQEQITDTKLCVSLQTAIETADAVLVPPYLLLTLTDNVMKYGWLTDPDEPAMIRVSANRNVLTFSTRNSKKPDVEHGLGIGLANVRQVLEVTYPQKYLLDIEDRDATYALKLTINLIAS